MSSVITVNPASLVACLFQHQLPGSPVAVESCLHCGLSVSAPAAWQHCVCGILFALWPVCFSISCQAALSHCGVLFALSVSASAAWHHCGVMFALWPVCFSISCLAALCLWNPVCIVACLFQHQLPGSTVESCLHCGLSVSASAVWQHCGVLFALWPVCFSISCLAALWSPVCSPAEL